MAVPYSVAEVVEQVQSLMNDQIGSIYPWTIQRPYINMALEELQLEFQLNNVPVTNKTTSTPIQVDAGVTEIAFNAVNPLPSLPSDLVEIQQLWERQRDIDPWLPMSRRDFIPHFLEGQALSYFGIFAWFDQIIHLPESNQDNDIKIDYIRTLFPVLEVGDDDYDIQVLNSKMYLSYKTSALISKFSGENPTRAEELNALATNSMDQVLGIAAKGRQMIKTRRRPFMNSYRNRRIVT